MNLDELKRALDAHMPVLANEPMSKHTTMKVGGPADLFLTCNSAADVSLAWRLAREAGVPFMALGNGSNLIVREGGIRGVVARLAMNTVEFSGEAASVEAGCQLSAFVMRALKAGRMGLEFAHGIPGTVGGAVVMNAGAYEHEIGERLIGVEGIDSDGEPFYKEAAKAQLGYRRSVFQRDGSIVLKTHWRLLEEDGHALERINEYAERRRLKQPLELPSAGSVFKRPEGHFTGRLIEDAGLRGVKAGGAMVSEKHAGFIVNTGGATASDVLDLIELIKRRVYDRFTVELETEVRIIGEDA